MTGEPSLCVKGCGFFSTSETKNMCSKCYNDFLKDESARHLATLDHTETAPEAAEKATVLEEAEEATAPSLCVKGCGFFSTSESKNLCSKCYSDFLKDESARYLATIKDHTETAPEAAEKATVLEEAEEATAPSLCIKGCGFFSTSESKNLCSKCYNDFLKDESARYLATLKDHTETAPEAAEKATVLEELEEATGEEVVVAKKKSIRCNACKKKVGILGFHCRCGHVFCGSHRYPEEHSCSWDYKSAAINDLVIQNPIIKGDKVSRI